MLMRNSTSRTRTCSCSICPSTGATILVYKEDMTALLRLGDVRILHLGLFEEHEMVFCIISCDDEYQGLFGRQ